MRPLLIFLFLVLWIVPTAISAQTPVTVVRIKYDGGGDWYGNRTTFVNLFDYLRRNAAIPAAEREITLSLDDKDLFRYPLAYIAGHGNIKFSDSEASQLRAYLQAGGFLWADDDYGMDVSFRREMKKVFPELDWVEVPYSHDIFTIKYRFPNGLPKIHKHDGGPPKGSALFLSGRMIAFYSQNTDISDGCEDSDIHNDPEPLRQSALQMGTNILLWALLQ